VLSVLIKRHFPYVWNGSDSKIQAWIYRFANRWSLSNRRRTHTATRDEENLGEMLFDFVNYFHVIRAENNITYYMIFNVDQTAVDLQDVFTRTMERRGTKSVKVKRPANIVKRVTVILCISFEGDFAMPQ
jgi:hypothetical protein